MICRQSKSTNQPILVLIFCNEEEKLILCQSAIVAVFCWHKQHPVILRCHGSSVGFFKGNNTWTLAHLCKDKCIQCLMKMVDELLFLKQYVAIFDRILCAYSYVILDIFNVRYLIKVNRTKIKGLANWLRSIRLHVQTHLKKKKLKLQRSTIFLMVYNYNYLFFIALRPLLIQI